MERGVEPAEAGAGAGAERLLDVDLPAERVSEANRPRKEVGVESFSGVGAEVLRLNGGVLGSLMELPVEAEEMEDSMEGGIVCSYLEGAETEAEANRCRYSVSLDSGIMYLKSRTA